MYCQHREKEGKDRLQETEKTMEEKTEQETVQETTCSGHEHEHDKPRYGRQNKSKSIYITKIAIVVFTLILQILFWVFLYGIAKNYMFYWKTLAILISATVVLYIVNKPENPAYKLTWILLMMVTPILGGVLYIAIAGNRTRMKFIRDAQKNHLDTFQYMPSDKSRQREIRKLSQSASVQSTYISKTAGYPVYKNTAVRYFPLGEDNFAKLVEELNNANHFIFMEYFIIKQGEMWDTILEIMERKAKEGVDVRLIYDDFGCSMWIPSRFIKDMKEKGIKVAAFNPIGPVFNLRQNNRDHRKITVIDGYVGFTGGINLADEYINKKSRFGHWKDTGIMLKGEAVWNLTLMFLQTWLMLTGEKDDYSSYSPEKYQDMAFFSDGYIQPYGDTPVDNEIVGENIYLNMINKAKHYVYITTPYLIIDNEMVTALTLAAKSGIDVRIITPGIPDKKLVFRLSRSYYLPLLRAGVRIYEFTPGFLHAKCYVSDDHVAVVGSINMDYRSLFLHFECGTLLYRNSQILALRDDALNTLRKCREVQLSDCRTTLLDTLLDSVLRLLSPLM